MRDIEQEIREVNATMAMSGIPLTEADKTRLRDILSGNCDIETVIKQLVEKHSRKVYSSSN